MKKIDEYEVVPLDDKPGWVGVFTWSNSSGHTCVAMFEVDFMEFAVEMCDRLEVRRLAGRTP